MKIKGLIRWSEAKAGAVVCGCAEDHLHFLDLPFYRTGTVAKKAVGDEDVRIIRQPANHPPRLRFAPGQDGEYHIC